MDKEGNIINNTNDEDNNTLEITGVDATITNKWKLTTQNTLQEWAITSQEWTITSQEWIQTWAMNLISQQMAKTNKTNYMMIKYPLKMKGRRTYM